MKRTDTTVANVQPGSIAEEAGIEPGDVLLKINGCDFYDILEYKYLISDNEVTLELKKKNGSIEELEIFTDYEDLGIEFHSDLIDDAKSCTNKCIFCFIDQLPPNMRETVYFKDDDTRLSFLQGNYVTLTNMSDEEIDRMIRMRISPINISVHTTNPELRKMMLGNRFAGKIYDVMKKFADNHIMMNCQIVLCPGINDGKELDSTVEDLAALYPYVGSVSAVPVGLSRYRDGLYPLKPYTPETSFEVIKQVEQHQSKLLKKLGTRLIYIADEFYINAGVPIPDAQAYEGFPQIENGVGLVASMYEEFCEAVKLIAENPRSRKVIIATGELVFEFIKSMAETIEKKAPGTEIEVYPIKNNFFGGGVNVTGLICGCDIIEQLAGKTDTFDALIISHDMLRGDDGIFLDDTTVEDVERELNIKVIPVYNDGYEFIEKILDEELF